MAKLLRAGKSFTCTQIARRFELSTKTIMRDLDFMRDRLRWEFDFNKSENTYKFRSAPEPVL